MFIIKKGAVSTDRPSDKLDYPLTQTRFRITVNKGNGAFELEMPPR
jgi:hypothetical protein